MTTDINLRHLAENLSLDGLSTENILKADFFEADDRLIYNEASQADQQISLTSPSDLNGNGTLAGLGQLSAGTAINSNPSQAMAAMPFAADNGSFGNSDQGSFTNAQGNLSGFAAINSAVPSLNSAQTQISANTVTNSNISINEQSSGGGSDVSIARNGQDGRNGSNGQDGNDGRDGQDGNDGHDDNVGNDGEDGEDGHDGHGGCDGDDGHDGGCHGGGHDHDGDCGDNKSCLDLDGIIQPIIQLVDHTLTNVTDNMTQIVDNLILQTTDITNDLLSQVTGSVDNLASQSIDTINDILAGIDDTGNNLVGQIVDGINSAGTDLAPIVTGILDPVVDQINNILTNPVGGSDSLVDNTLATVGGVFASTFDVTESVIGPVDDVANGLGLGPNISGGNLLELVADIQGNGDSQQLLILGTTDVHVGLDVITDVTNIQPSLIDLNVDVNNLSLQDLPAVDTDLSIAGNPIIDVGLDLHGADPEVGQLIMQATDWFNDTHLSAGVGGLGVGVEHSSSWLEAIQQPITSVVESAAGAVGVVSHDAAPAVTAHAAVAPIAPVVHEVLHPHILGL